MKTPTLFDPSEGWPQPDMCLLTPVREPAPKLSEEMFDWIYGSWSRWIATAASAKGAPKDYVALGLLSTASALIGNARWPEAFEGCWSEPPVLWCMLVGDPSAGKSPALDAVMAPLREIEQEFQKEFEMKLSEWEIANEFANLHKADWKKEANNAIAEGSDPPPLRPEAQVESAPIRKRIRVSDTTTEKLAELLCQNTDGVLMYRDELAGWLGSMDRYSGGGGDRPFWLEAYGGRSFTVDRKSLPEPITIDRLSVAIVGGR